MTLAALLLTSGALAEGPRERQDQGRPLLLGGAIAPSAAEVRLDPVLPHGERREEMPGPLEKSRCSLRRPVCVQGSDHVRDEELRAGLTHLELAYESHVYGTDLGRPRATFERPLRWQVSGLRESAVGLLVQPSLIASRGFDEGRAECAGGTLTEETAISCVTQAALLSQAPTAAPWLRAGLGASFARGLLRGEQAEAAARSSLLRPHVGVLTNSNSGLASRSVRFFDYLEARSTNGLGEASFLALSLAATRTWGGALRFEAEPDVMEVLSATYFGERNDVARFFDDFAQESADLAGDYGGELELDWEVLGSTLPRSLAFSQPMEPTGSVYLRVTLTEELKQKQLAFRMWCEAPVSYVWSVARLDKEEKEISRVVVAYRERGTDAATTVEPAPGTEFLRLSGTNMGGIDLAHPFDPDHGPHETHACRVAIDVL